MTIGYTYTLDTNNKFFLIESALQYTQKFLFTHRTYLKYMSVWFKQYLYFAKRYTKKIKVLSLLELKTGKRNLFDLISILFYFSFIWCVFTYYTFNRKFLQKYKESQVKLNQPLSQYAITSKFVYFLNDLFLIKRR